MNKILIFLVGVLIILSIIDCRDSKVASRNISYKSDSFEVHRRIVFYNGITDSYILSIEGLCSINKDEKDNQLEVICKVSPEKYVKHFLGISDNVTYFVEHLKFTNVSLKNYNVLFKPSVIIPNVEVK